MPTLDKITLYFFFFTFFVFLLVPVACANPTFATPKFVFTDFVNLTGWDSFAAFMIGLSGVTTVSMRIDGQWNSLVMVAEYGADHLPSVHAARLSEGQMPSHILLRRS